MTYTVAVVGATGKVGWEILSILVERCFPVKDLIALASERSAGKRLSFAQGQTLDVQDLSTFDFRSTDIVLSSAGAQVSASFVPVALRAGALVIDNTSYFRMHPEVPLVVPEVNPEALWQHKGIIANPNCSTIQMVMALKPLHDKSSIQRVVVSTYQSVSGAGSMAIKEFWEQTRNLIQDKENIPYRFTKPIAGNVIPHIDVFLENGATKEEWKMEVETQKILDPTIAVHATCVRVPVLVGHAEAVNVTLENPLTVEQAREMLRQAVGVWVMDERKDKGYITPREAAGQDWVYVSRIRQDCTVEHGLSFWIVSDNLRKGAALNAVQIAECLIEKQSVT